MPEETQEQQPKVHLSLEEVGITDFKTQITITRGTKIYRYTTDITVVINLSSSKKGVHMSRFIESISEILSSKTGKNEYYSLEEMSIQVLNELNSRHPFEKGIMQLDFDFFTLRTTPVSQRQSLENYQGKLLTIWKKNEVIHELTLGTYGGTACPHALANNDKQRTHIQRAYAEIKMTGKTEEIPDMENISKIIDQSFSAPTYSLLKLEDEQWLVNQLHENPLFVEDVTRNLLENANSEFKGSNLEIEATTKSLESIHKHNVISKGKISIVE